MKMELQNKELFATQQGTDTPPTVSFREVNPFKLWVSGVRGPRSMQAAQPHALLRVVGGHNLWLWRHHEHKCLALDLPARLTPPGRVAALAPTGTCTQTPHTTLQVWLEFVQTPSTREVDLAEAVLKAWFMIGKLGGYNSQNLQVLSVGTFHLRRCLVGAP